MERSRSPSPKKIRMDRTASRSRSPSPPTSLTQSSPVREHQTFSQVQREALEIDDEIRKIRNEDPLINEALSTQKSNGVSST